MKSVVHLSGGFDSAAAALHELDNGVECVGFFADYGQPYLVQEQDSALKLHGYFSGKYKNWLGLRAVRTSLCVESSTDNFAYVPMRNLVLVSLSVNVAVALGIENITIGSKGKGEQFVDCSQEFYKALEDAINLGIEPNQSRITLRRPLADMTKVDVLQKLVNAGIDLDSLWSCYNSGTKPCGTCAHCQVISAARKRIDTHPPGC